MVGLCADLLESNVAGVLAEATAADGQAVLADDAVSVVAHAASDDKHNTAATQPVTQRSAYCPSVGRWKDMRATVSFAGCEGIAMPLMMRNDRHYDLTEAVGLGRMRWERTKRMRRGTIERGRRVTARTREADEARKR